MAKHKPLLPIDAAPTPYVEPLLDDPGRFWTDDPWDINLPRSPGYISDFVAHCRGYETSTAYCMWSAIFYISSVIRREAWIEWGYGKLFANFYLLLVGPAGVAKKGTAIELGFDAFAAARAHITDINLREIKRFNILRNKASPEALVSVLSDMRKRYHENWQMIDAQGKPLLTADGKPMIYNRTSAVTIVVPELSTMLSKAEYARPIVNVLTDIYDCKDKWEVRTQTRGHEVLRYTFTNFIGAVTPRGLESSIPEEASEDGFLSRCVVVYQRSSNRCFPKPIRTGPTTDDLARRLAWIACHTSGEHHLSPEADAFYAEWYRNWKHTLETSHRPYASSRAAIHALQLSLVLKASRYSSSPTIELVDIQDAVRIIERTTGTYKAMFEQTESTTFYSRLRMLERKICKHKAVTRRSLLVGSHRTADELNALIGHLYQTGRVQIMREGEEQSFPSTDGREIYRWVGGASRLTTDDEVDDGSDDDG